MNGFLMINGQPSYAAVPLMPYQQGNLQNGVRQYDVPIANGLFYEIPSSAKGRIMADDFVFFKWSGNFNPQKYEILIQSLDTAGTLWRNIGQVTSKVKLPFVHFDPYGKLALVSAGGDQRMPTFSNILVRGATYLIPDVGNQSGDFTLERFGGKF
jgi:hypothetical protein